MLCLGVFGGAAAFYLWVYALERTTPTRVANTMTVNPIAASLLAAALIGEPLGRISSLRRGGGRRRHLARVLRSRGR